MVEVPLNQLPDVRIGRPDLVPDILEAVRQAATEMTRQGQNFAPPPSLKQVNHLLAMAFAKCDFDPPPPPEIEMVVDNDGSLVYRCQHAIPHRWRLNGTPK
ncbi:hypothetical protein [Neorhizobium galegae]|uniref:hypothetical protein n=1 Tax=Neorhizobium galegae TaxID=399 RepID=UPI001F258A7B|nr:hypothetical protein [Neorhizobium galegae]UIK07853.1 hypothetical protein LZK81_25835 [Neorhizobium galegae]